MSVLLSVDPSSHWSLPGSVTDYGDALAMTSWYLDIDCSGL